MSEKNIKFKRKITIDELFLAKQKRVVGVKKAYL